jgi:hypothetical protein
MTLIGLLGDLIDLRSCLLHGIYGNVGKYIMRTCGVVADPITSPICTAGHQHFLQRAMGLLTG